jgi:hypothetical protein
MRAILINPEEKKVSEIQIGNDYKEIYKVIDCELFTCPITYENGDTMYCDDEGLFKEQKGGIIMRGWSYPILGKILILGCDEETGDSQDVKSSIDFFEKQIMWLSEEQTNNYKSNFC